MLNEVYTMDWPAMSAELLRKNLSEKMEQLFLRSKNRQFVLTTELENTGMDCCLDDTNSEPEEIL
jgi:hypothetical protein